MNKKVNASNYFLDIGSLSIISIIGFYLGVSKWIGVIGIFIYTLISIIGTVHLQNINVKS